MPHIPPLDAERAPEASRPWLASLRSAQGTVLNFYAVLAHAPAALEGYVLLKKSLSAGVLTPELRERVAVRVAQVNACEYCLGAHVGVLRRLRVPEEEILAARRGEAADPRSADALRLVDDILFGRPASPGSLTAQEALEVAAHVALNVFSNAVNGIARTELDVPRVPLAQPHSRLDVPAP